MLELPAQDGGGGGGKLERPDVIVASPDAAAMLREGLMSKGLKGKFVVYEDPKLEKGQLLITRNGKSTLDTGYIHAPYVPMGYIHAPYVPMERTPARKPIKTPLEEVIEGVFAEEIEEGKLKPIRKTGREYLSQNPCDEIPLVEAQGCNLRPVQPPMFDPNDFSIRKGIRTRFAKKIIDPKFVTKVDVTDL